MKKTPKKTRLSKRLPGLPPVAPPSPPPVQLDDGVSLLSQAFEAAGVLGNTLLAAQIAGGMSRLSQVLRRVAALEKQLATALSIGVQSPAVPPQPEAPPAA